LGSLNAATTLNFTNSVPSTIKSNGQSGDSFTYIGGGSLLFQNYIGSYDTRFAIMRTTGNVIIQNGGTFTDAGFRLDVNGTARLANKLSVGTPSAASALMEVTSTTQGVLIPRMTLAQRNAITTPAAGLQVIVTGETWGEFLSFYNADRSTWERAVMSRSSVLSCVFIGLQAGLNATAISNSNFIGPSAGSGATSANNSNFLGNGAGSGATNANGSNFLGSSAGINATNAGSSNFFGTGCGEAATGASAANFFGPYAGYQASGASGSNFIGSGAGQSATNANNSNFIGRNNGNGATGANHSNFIGFNVGHSSRHAITGANNILIGTNITTPTAATANSANIGGVLYLNNTYATTSGSPQATAQTNGKVGINTTTPVASAVLEIVSTTAGVLFPRMTTTQKLAIVTPAEGLVVYDTTLAKLCLYTTTWETITSI
jgi:hypothetical protein